MIDYILAFVASFFFIAFKSFQQLNVVRRAYKWVIPTGLCMAACEVYVIVNIAKHGFGPLVFWVGLGGSLGSMLAMYLHFAKVKGKSL